MASFGEYRVVPVEEIELDESNPRIAYFLEHLPPPHTAEQIYMALGAGADDDGGGRPSFNRLKQSIQTHGKVVNPVILRQVGPEEYLCIEGNTRVALYREFLESKTPGSWDRIPAVVHPAIDDDETHAIRLQAHLVGPRPWTPYAKAKYLTYLRTQEHFEFSRLVDFCGGNERSIRESLDAYADMEKHYRPLVDPDDAFDITRFSSFVELQKPGVKEAIARAGFSLDDFSRWIVEDKLEKNADVRWLPKVLRDKKATNTFVKSGIQEAIKLTDAPDLSKALQDATLVSLARALTEKIRRIEHRDVKRLQADPTSQTAQYLLEAHEALKEIAADIGAE